ncbi:uncharacterized protein PFL1_06130 [Pseudozyma flocculosa PF-1]|uniref:C2H2-type domain-containing protein n=2 Tax=Pseudozyma flocculosa TaxID=84751 RepID=A0A5C3F8U8_9BASI|nr:uncharacterized protein PFL1_06130 [Pseudozyma flocculosa PF-1]EPQ26194.1 hypothetical protein PFL1_06130 [Pseudozyma flocculosa PF-1]SPO40147.1 uncharacterized protein PSFLO_05629 [Pseudozyma flocculosa]
MMDSGGSTAKRRTLDPASTRAEPASGSSGAAQQPLTCTLPPHRKPLVFASPAEFENHYRNNHAFFCTLPASNLPLHRLAGDDVNGGEASSSQPPPQQQQQQHQGQQQGGQQSRQRRRKQTGTCGKVFPSDHFLQLHIEECHSPLARERMARGDKTFGCFLSPDACTRSFATPKERRLHLVDAHGFPSTFFFSLPNHGTGQLEKRYGPGASLVRGAWRPSKGEGDGNSNGDGDGEIDEVDMDEGLDEEGEEEAPSGGHGTSVSSSRKRKEASYSPEPISAPTPTPTTAAVPSSSSSSSSTRLQPPAPLDASAASGPSSTLKGADEALLESMSSLSLVPPSVRSRAKKSQQQGGELKSLPSPSPSQSQSFAARP